VWIGGADLVRYTCPVLDLHSNSETLTLFDLCYDTVIDVNTAPRFERRALPVSGGMNEQPAKLMQEFTQLERIATEELREDIREYRNKSKTDVE
jgi:hypothetical protein